MSEQYLSTIRDAFTDYSQGDLRIAPVPGEIIAASLELRHEPITAAMNEAFVEYLDTTNLSPEDHDLLSQRVLGGMASRIALASHGIDLKRSQWVPYFDLAESDQVEVMSDAAARFAVGLTVGLEQAGLGLDDVLKADERSAKIVASADPTSVPHQFMRTQLYAYKRGQRTMGDRWKRLRQYANIDIGSYPEDPLPETAIGRHDSVLVQAFGRNNFTDKELPTVRGLYDREAAGDDMAMWGILDNIGFDAGASNQALAEAVEERVMGPGQVMEAPIQWEVAYALWQRDPEAYGRYKNYIHSLWPESGFYPTTEVKKDSLQVMDRVGLYNPQELAHPDMMVRAMAILSKLGIEADPVAADIPFDPESVQGQVRNESAWKRREALTRVHHVLFGKVKF